MSDVVIEARGLGKRYRLRHQAGPAYKSLREEIAAGLKRLRGPDTSAQRAPAAEDFWALRDVSFDIRQGEVIGIVGRNGAGKSTLLKLLSRITEPTEGRARVRGRVASLLEVGTGFHPELTGRENIYLNGVILGMTRAAVRKRFDEIVAFAEVERFVDTPVKHYSSGMYVRLAFSVAAHLEPDILVIDEVLSVGDAQFQKKCLGRLGEITGGEGRTVLFVSHNMVAVAAICKHVLWLTSGTTTAYGPADETIRRYLAASVDAPAQGAGARRHAGTDVRVESVQLYVDGSPTNGVQSGEACELRVGLRRLGGASGVISVSVMLYCEGQKIVNLWTNCQPDFLATFGGTAAERYTAVCRIPRWPFRAATIRVDVFTHIGPVTQDWLEEALIFESRDGDYFGSGVVPNPDQGILFLEHRWSTHADQ